jgi:hypothetical protein
MVCVLSRIFCLLFIGGIVESNFHTKTWAVDNTKLRVKSIVDSLLNINANNNEKQQNNDNPNNNEINNKQHDQNNNAQDQNGSDTHNKKHHKAQNKKTTSSKNQKKTSASKIKGKSLIKRKEGSSKNSIAPTWKRLKMSPNDKKNIYTVKNIDTRNVHTNSYLNKIKASSSSDYLKLKKHQSANYRHQIKSKYNYVIKSYGDQTTSSAKHTSTHDDASNIKMNQKLTTKNNYFRDKSKCKSGCGGT